MRFFEIGKIKYHGKCTADFQPFHDGKCYGCMFYVDDDCGYLIRDEAARGEAKTTP